ncbi:MAG TPA: hypothetical protein VMS99_04355 [Acidimicrobiia bacterium]|nr:hypothetical protein [Acidimicrobiia bacterium]
MISVVVVLSIGLVACGAETGANDNDNDSSATTDAAPASTAVTEPDPVTTQPAGGTDPDDSGQEVVLEGGSATFTLDGERTDFDYFFCAFGYGATEDDDIIFLAVGEGTDSAGVPVQVLVHLWDSRDQDSIRDGLQEVAYFVQGDSGSFIFGWGLAVFQAQEDIQGEEEIEIEEDRVTANGTFENEAGEQASGSLDATCSPNSLR